MFGSVLMMPTVYSVTPAVATRLRPGSTSSRGSGMPCAAQEAFTAAVMVSANSSMEAGLSSAV